MGPAGESADRKPVRVRRKPDASPRAATRTENLQNGQRKPVRGPEAMIGTSIRARDSLDASIVNGAGEQGQKLSWFGARGPLRPVGRQGERQHMNYRRPTLRVGLRPQPTRRVGLHLRALRVGLRPSRLGESAYGLRPRPTRRVGLRLRALRVGVGPRHLDLPINRRNA